MPQLAIVASVTLNELSFCLYGMDKLPVSLSFSCVGMPLKACLCPGYSSVSQSGWHFLLVGRKEESESHMPALARPETDTPVRGRKK